jgi:hypothetical protein
MFKSEFQNFKNNVTYNSINYENASIDHILKVYYISNIYHKQITYSISIQLSSN